MKTKNSIDFKDIKSYLSRKPNHKIKLYHNSQKVGNIEMDKEDGAFTVTLDINETFDKTNKVFYFEADLHEWLYSLKHIITII